MPQTAVLLGAGASIDAGIPSAFALTEKVYKHLRRFRRDEAKLFGYVLAKLVTKRARKGLSPFDPVNIEDVYDSLKRYLLRQEDPLNEFVYSWDDTLEANSFDAVGFKRALEKLLTVNERAGRYQIGLDSWATQDLIKILDQAFSGGKPRARIEEYTKALCECLRPSDTHHEYLQDLCRFVQRECDVVGTLNYDTLIEENCKEIGLVCDTGLTKWNESREVKYVSGAIKLVKIHGSADWFEDGDNILEPQAAKGFYRRGMIFGGQGEKLVPHGPYLQLRNEFQRITHDATRLGIIGYSFQDIHMNALLRTWMATKRKAKLVILNPAKHSQFLPNIGRWSEVDKTGKRNVRVEVVHIQLSASAGMQRFINEMSAEPDLVLAARESTGIRTISTDQ